MSLAGKRILVLRPAHQAAELAGRIEASGGEPVVIPAIKIEPAPALARARRPRVLSRPSSMVLGRGSGPRPDPAQDLNEIDDLLAKLEEFDWLVFTSANGAEIIAPRIGANRAKKIAAVGPGTRAALKLYGFTTDWMPTSFDVNTLANELPGTGRVLIVRAIGADEEGDEILRRRGFEVERIDAYRTKPINAELLAAAAGEVDAIAFTSASTVESFRAAVPGEVSAAVCSIGPATSAACARAGLKVAVEAPEHTIPGLVKAIDQYLTN